MLTRRGGSGDRGGTSGMDTREPWKGLTGEALKEQRVGAGKLRLEGERSSLGK